MTNETVTSSVKSLTEAIKDANYFSVYKAPVTKTTPLKDVILQDVYRVVRSEKYKMITGQLRLLNGDETKSQELKRTQLDYVTFSGTFTNRSDAALTSRSNLFCVDLDHLSNIQGIRELIFKDYIPALMFTSPRGNGLKIVYRIDISAADHITYFKAFEAYFKSLGQEIDKQCKDISRACFLCHDPDCFYSHDPTIMGRSFIDTFTKRGELITARTQISSKGIYDRLKTWLDKQESFCRGNRNNYITKMALACNTFGLPQGELESMLTEFIQEDFPEKEILSTVKSIYLNHSADLGTKHFDISAPYNFPEPEEREPIPDTPLLPIDGLPEFIQDLICECSSVYGTHRDFWAGAILSATALGIGNRCQINNKTYVNSPVLWLVLVAPSGVGKTEPLKFALKSFHYLDSMEMERYEQAVKEFEVNKKKPREEQTEMDPPIYKQHILSDATPEAVIQANKSNPRGILIERDELHGWLLDFGRYTKSGEVQNWTSAWSQSPMTVNRKGQAPLKIEIPFINVSGGIQPEILPELAKEHRDVNGFLQRFCFVFPDKTLRPYCSNKELREELITAYRDYINRLLAINEQDQIRLSDEAEQIYNNFHDRNADVINKELINYLRTIYSKLEIICLRLALIIHVMKWACTGSAEPLITPETMQTAIKITEYFKMTGVKVYHALGKINKYDKKELIRYLSTLGNSQNQIAEVIKVSQQYVNRVLNEKKS